MDEGLGAWIALCFGVWVQNSVRLARRREKPEIRLESREIGCIQYRYINLRKKRLGGCNGNSEKSAQPSLRCCHDLLCKLGKPSGPSRMHGRPAHRFDLRLRRSEVHLLCRHSFVLTEIAAHLCRYKIQAPGLSSESILDKI